MAAAINPNKTLSQRQQETRARNDRSLFQRVADRQAALSKPQSARTESKRL